jgi:hypothetical protein
LEWTGTLLLLVWLEERESLSQLSLREYRHTRTQT